MEQFDHIEKPKMWRVTTWFLDKIFQKYQYYFKLKVVNLQLASADTVKANIDSLKEEIRVSKNEIIKLRTELAKTGFIEEPDGSEKLHCYKNENGVMVKTGEELREKFLSAGETDPVEPTVK